MAYSTFKDNGKIKYLHGYRILHVHSVFDNKHKIYTDSNYNRFIYRGKYWLSREQILANDPEIVEIFDKMFKSFDTDGSGTVEKSEMAQFVKKLIGSDNK